MALQKCNQIVTSHIKIFFLNQKVKSCGTTLKFFSFLVFAIIRLYPVYFISGFSMSLSGSRVQHLLTSDSDDDMTEDREPVQESATPWLMRSIQKFITFKPDARVIHTGASGKFRCTSKPYITNSDLVSFRKANVGTFDNE